ncbi:MAG: polyphosphate kinase 1 [Cyclobacteriaceae bacterium]
MKNYTYFDRDLSWLSFNERVMKEARSPDIPLIEAIKFLGIYSSNLDEFYRVRYPLLNARKKLDQHHEQKEHTNAVDQFIEKQLNEFGETIRFLVDQLAKKDIIWLYGKPFPEELYAKVDAFFLTEMLAHIQPVQLSNRKGGFFPENNLIYFAIQVAGEGRQDFILPLPMIKLERFQVVKQGGKTYVVFIDDILKRNLNWIFPQAKEISVFSFKVSRDASLDLNEEINEETLKEIPSLLEKREVGFATRLLHEPRVSTEFLHRVKSALDLGSASVVEGGRYHQLKELMKFPKLSTLESEKTQWQRSAYPLNVHESIFLQIDRQDVLIHTPYQKFDPVLRFFNEGAINPAVEEIYLTIYRVANNSLILNALVSAAKNGKRVTVFVELKARFDEENNLAWSKRMERAGIRVIYSNPRLKVHAKVALLKVRREQGVKIYGLYGTGNLNEGTAALYTDHFLLTANPSLNNELQTVFTFLARRKKPGKSDAEKFKVLLVSQFNLQERFLFQIRREMEIVATGGSGSIFMKMNNLEEQSMIDALYQASQSGVQIRLLVRGICRLVPGIKGQSENIRVRRIVDNYLEHGRVFIFENQGKQAVFMGSADWMNRNIFHRIEVCFPILDHKQRIFCQELMELQWRDTEKATELEEGYSNNAVVKPGVPIRSQEAIGKLLTKSHE